MVKLIARVLAFKLVLDGLRARRGRERASAEPSAPRPVSRPHQRRRRPQRHDDERSDPQRGEVPAQTGEGSQPGSPLELGRKDWKQTATRTLKEIKADGVPFAAAAMAYYGFLALFPAIIAAIGILGLLQVPEETTRSFERSMSGALPSGASDIVRGAIENANESARSASLAAALIGIAVALWSASSGFVALQKGLDVAYDVEEGRKFLKARLVAFVLIIATGLLGGVPSPFFMFGETTFLRTLGWILTAAAVVILFSVFYYLGPKRDSPRWTWVSPGGILGAALWLTVSGAFAFYVDEFSSYGETYGSVAGVVVLILWLYLTSMSVLIGAELNAELEREAAGKTSTS